MRTVCLLAIIALIAFGCAKNEAEAPSRQQESEAAGGRHMSGNRGPSIGIATADWVPSLVAAGDGSCVAAIDAGWGGRAAGVIESGVAGLREATNCEPLLAAIGPAARGCCYEVDEAVLGPLRARFPEELANATRATSAGHALLDLAVLVQADLARAGVAASQRSTIAGACTRCDASRFHSYRRDGESAGRLLHFIVPR